MRLHRIFGLLCFSASDCPQSILLHSLVAKVTFRYLYHLSPPFKPKVRIKKMASSVKHVTQAGFPSSIFFLATAGKMSIQNQECTCLKKSCTLFFLIFIHEQ